MREIRYEASDTGAGSWLLPRQIGMLAALRPLFTVDKLTAARTGELGYVDCR